MDGLRENCDAPEQQACYLRNKRRNLIGYKLLAEHDPESIKPARARFLLEGKPIVLVYSSSNAWAQSMAQVISTLMPYTSQAVTTQAMLLERLNETADRSTPPTVMIHLPHSAEYVAAECVRWIDRLRCKNPFWMGGLLVITNSPASKEAVQRIDVRSGAQSRTGTFEAIPEAHKVLASPPAVVSVCQNICDLRSPGLFVNAWMRFYRSGPLCRSQTLIGEARALVAADELGKALEKWPDILKTLKDICWNRFHLHGITANTLNAVLAARPTAETIGCTLELAQSVLDAVFQA